jgi:hypothetical protein
MTPAEQYRTLIDRLQVLAEAVLTSQQIMAMTPQDRVAKIVAMTPQERDDLYKSMTDQEIDELLASWPKTPAPAPTTAPPADITPVTPVIPLAATPQAMAQFKNRCEGLLDTLAAHANIWDQQIISRTGVRVVDDPKADMYAMSRYREITIDYGQWHDAPDDVLLWNLGHEVGHIVMNHRGATSPANAGPYAAQQREAAADKYATQLCLSMGLTKAPAFKWANDKKGEFYHQATLMVQNNPEYADDYKLGTHPTLQQRYDAAKAQGFDLSKNNTDQLDRFLAHMSGTA